MALVKAAEDGNIQACWKYAVFRRDEQATQPVHPSRRSVRPYLHRPALNT